MGTRKMGEGREQTAPARDSDLCLSALRGGDRGVPKTGDAAAGGVGGDCAGEQLPRLPKELPYLVALLSLGIVGEPGAEMD